MSYFESIPIKITLNLSIYFLQSNLEGIFNFQSQILHKKIVDGNHRFNYMDMI
jgi:hypothetical protein